MLTSNEKPAAGPSARWYAVKSQPNREALACAHLLNQGFTVFLPRGQRVRRHARKTDVVLAPFFPGYLFVRLDLTRDRWRCVNSTHGVANLVMQGAVPAAVPAGIIEQLQARCDDRGVLDMDIRLKPGQPVRILTGALADFVGELERQDAADRVSVLLTILGKPTSVVLPRHSVVPESLSA
jgi:transcription elongation factor/antiterminator RfaH